MLDTTTIVACSIAVAYLALQGAKALWAWRYASAHPDSVAIVEQSIDVMQPILSGDPDLESALRDNLNLTGSSPLVRFIWLVDRDDLQGIELTTRLQSEHPERVEIVITEPYSGVGNPKVQKLIRGLEVSRATWIAVLDDDTRLSEYQLGSAIEWLKTGVTLYTGLPSYDPAPNLPSRLVANFVNVSSVFTYLSPLRFLRPLTLNGMFYVTSAAWLRETKAFEAIEAELCDDYALARFLLHSGGSIHQGIASQRIRTTVHSWSHYIRLMHRWMLFADLLVRDQPILRRAGLGVLLLLPTLLLWSLAIAIMFVPWGWLILVAVLLIREILIRGTRRAIGLGGATHGVFLGLVGELVVPLHALHAMMQRTIQWRTRRFRVSMRGEFQSLS